MILPLRRLHRSVFAGLALLLPALLASAWRVRPEPLTEALPPELLPGPPEIPGGAAAEPTGAHPGEDLLVYWSPSPADADEGLPPEAELVGTRRSGALERTPPEGRHVLLYSLLEQRVVGLPREADGD